MRFLIILTSACLGGAASIPHTRRGERSWAYQGCYSDDVGRRTLAYNSNRNYDIQTVDTCVSYCQANNFYWAGLEYGSECYCDYQLPAAAVKQPDENCSIPCAGNASETCGNANRLSVYSGSTAARSPMINPGPDGWVSQACYTDSSNARTLGTPQSVNAGSAGMTVAQCTSACASNGYLLAGVEYGSECYCDSEIRNAASVASSGCDMLCSANSSEFCGGQSRVQVYKAVNPASSPSTGSLSGWTKLGCFTDNGNSRTLATQQEILGGSSNMTVEGCLGVCSTLGYSLGGVEYSQECYCGHEIRNGGACAADQSTCYMPCKGNSAEVCGGPDRLNVYYSGDGEGLTSCDGGHVPSSTTVSTASSSTSSTVSSQPQNPSSVHISSTSRSTPSLASTTTSTTPEPTPTPPSNPPPCTPPPNPSCPPFWTPIIATLAPPLRSPTGECTPLARSAIRFAFHDSFPINTTHPSPPASGGSDGSLLLSPPEILRPENLGLAPYHATLLSHYRAFRAAGYCVSAADLVQVAAALAILACPGGRVGRVFVGRTDSDVPASEGLLPVAFGPGADHDTLLKLFTDKGFSARDLAALVGAHSTSVAESQSANGIPAGTPQDSTPGVWDVGYYAETLGGGVGAGGGVGRFESDINLSNASTVVGKQFASFVGAQASWGASFSSAWGVMATLGISREGRAGMGDCTEVVVGAFA